MHCHSPRILFALARSIGWRPSLAQCLVPSCPSVFTFPRPGKLCRCGLRLVPYRHGAKQIPRKQGRKTGTAVSRHHIGSPCTSGTDRNRRILDGSGSISFPGPAPETVGLHFPENLAWGRRRQRCDGGLAASGGERKRSFRPGSGTGPAFGVSSFGERLSDSSPGTSRQAETSRRADPRTCKLWVTALFGATSTPSVGIPCPLLYPLTPEDGCSITSIRTDCSSPSLEMAIPLPSVLDDVRSTVPEG